MQNDALYTALRSLEGNAKKLAGDDWESLLHDAYVKARETDSKPERLGPWLNRMLPKLLPGGRMSDLTSNDRATKKRLQYMEVACVIMGLLAFVVFVISKNISAAIMSAAYVSASIRAITP